MRVFRLDLPFKESIAVRAERNQRVGQVAAELNQLRPWVSGSAGWFGAKAGDPR
jgi:hypothetical protein